MALCLASIAIQLPGVLVDYAKVGIEQVRQSAGSVPDRMYTWEGSPLGANTVAMLWGVPQNVKYLIGTEAPPPVDRSADADRRDFSQQFAFSLDFWWLYLYYLGAVSAPVAVLLGLAPLLLAAWLTRRLFWSLDTGTVTSGLGERPR
jgi:hypothetical protein